MAANHEPVPATALVANRGQGRRAVVSPGNSANDCVGTVNYRYREHGQSGDFWVTREMPQQSKKRGFAANFEDSLVAGDCHNGPLFIIILFELLVALAFLFFADASARVLRLNCKEGDPACKNFNIVLLSVFVSRLILTVLGAIYSDILFFARRVGLSLSLNGDICKQAVAARRRTAMSSTR